MKKFSYICSRTWHYTLVFLSMILLFALYPICIEDVIYNDIIYPYIYSQSNYDLSVSRSELLYEIMRFVPLFYISILGLVVSMFNTVVYCVVNTKKDEKTINIILALISIFLISTIVAFLWNTYKNLDFYLFVDKIIKDPIKCIDNEYDNFSIFVIIITFVTILLFIGIDLKDYWQISKSLHKENKAENKEKLCLDSKYSFFQLLLIDVPIFAVSMIITVYNIYWDESYLPIFLTKGHAFRNIFSAGAWGIQIVYSQIVFYFLMLFYYGDRWKLKRKMEVEKKQ